MGLLTTIIGFFKSEVLDIWSKVSMSFNTLILTLAEDEVVLMGKAKAKFAADMAANKPFGVAVAEAWDVLENGEGVELSKVGNLLMQAWFAKFEA